MKKIRTLVLLGAAGISILTMSFSTSKTHSAKADTRSMVKEQKTMINPKAAATSNDEEAFTPLVTVALAESSYAATLVATASLIGICDSSPQVAMLKADAQRVEFKSLDK